MERVLVDTNTLWNFAAVDRLDLLSLRYGARLGWTATVASEVGDNVGRVPALGQLLESGAMGEPIEIPESDLPRVFQIRAALADIDDPMSKHLGEAETIFVAETVAPRAWFLTDDRAAGDLARHRGLHVKLSKDVLADCHSMAELGCPEAYELLVAMKESGRGVYVPSGGHVAVCP